MSSSRFPTASCILAAALAFAGAVRSQEVAPKADDDIETKVIRKFEDLARAKIVTGKVESIDKRKSEIVVSVDGDAVRMKVDRHTEVLAKIDIRGPDGKPATKQQPSLLYRLKEGQNVTVYLNEDKGRVIRIIVDKTGVK
jgi:hypothetical protein